MSELVKCRVTNVLFALFEASFTQGKHTDSSFLPTTSILEYARKDALTLGNDKDALGVEDGKIKMSICKILHERAEFSFRKEVVIPQRNQPALLYALTQKPPSHPSKQKHYFI